MAYINGMGGYGGGGVSSIYGNRNVISGLASGMDTESMIENAVSGYKMKINALQQKRTIEEWKQNTYRDVIAKMAKITDKYTSYSSPTNLMSGSFFNSAVTVTTQGTHADKVSASGRTDSDIQILGVQQLATSATHKVTGIGGGGTIPSFTGAAIDLNQEVEVSKVAGNMTINYGGDSKITINFAEDEVFKDDRMKDGFLVNEKDEFIDKDGNVVTDKDKFVKGKTAMEKMKDAMVEKLSKENITIGENTYKASERIDVEYDAVNQKITLKDKSGANNAVYVSGASEGQRETLGIDLKQNDKNSGKFVTSFGSTGDLHKVDGTVGDKLSGQEIQVTFDGVTRTIKLPKYNKDSANKGPEEFSSVADLASHLNTELGNKFGDGKIEVANDGGALKFTVLQTGSSLSISANKSSVVNGLGLKDHNSTFVNPQKTLGQIWGDKIDWTDSKLTQSEAKGDKDGKITTRRDADGNMYKVDAEGYRLKLKDGADEKSMDAKDYVRVDEKGNALYDFKVNDVVVGSFNQDTELSTVLRAINNNTEAGVSVSYSQTTDQFTFTAKQSGKAGKVEFSGGLAEKLFNTDYDGADNGITMNDKKGDDAILSMKVNGETLENVTRSDNNFTVDGLSITLKDTFGYVDEMGSDGKPTGNQVLDADAAKDAVTFKSTADSDKIVDAVKEFVKDFNDMMTTLKETYSTLPAQKSNGKPYLPLTDEDRKEMGETAAKEYEEKAKQGILFADRELSSLYDRLRNAISMGGKDGADMRSIGLTVEYSNGLSTLKLDENALRAALDTDPDKVRDVFSKVAGSGSQTDGLMQAIKKPLDIYGKVTGGKGVLVELAGSPLAPTTLYNNTLYQKMGRLDEQILALEKKMSSQVDRYTHQFSQMEQLIAQMNSQSGALAGLMGGF